jgi:hypothetical protein
MENPPDFRRRLSSRCRLKCRSLSRIGLRGRGRPRLRRRRTCSAHSADAVVSRFWFANRAATSVLSLARVRGHRVVRAPCGIRKGIGFDKLLRLIRSIACCQCQPLVVSQVRSMGAMGYPHSHVWSDPIVRQLEECWTVSMARGRAYLWRLSGAMISYTYSMSISPGGQSLPFSIRPLPWL